VIKPRRSSEEDRRIILELSKELAAGFGKNAEALDRTGKFSREHYQLAHDAGYMRLTLPKEHNGWGADVYTFCLAQEELAQGCAGTALAINMHLSIQSVLSYLLTPEQKAAVFSEAAGKQITFAGGGTEESSGGNWQSVTASAEKTAGGYVLNGRKKFCSGALAADYFWNFYMLTDLKDSQLPIGSTSFLARRSMPGLSVVETWDSMGMRASGSDDLLLDHVLVPDDALVGRPGLGFAQASKRLYWFLLGEVAVYVGVASAALRETIQYVRRRHAKFQGTQMGPGLETQILVGEMSARLAAARSLLHQTATSFASEEVERTGSTSELLAQAAQTKYFATRTCIEVVDIALQIAGGFGFLKGSPIERHYRDVRGGPFHPPRNVPTALSLAGRHLLGLNLDPNAV
jgi:alkylation response protein AidB-like acyl-CoA dehydrogenase